MFAIDWSAEAAHLSAAADLDRGWNESVARSLVRSTDRLVADVGCGGGGMASALAAELPDGVSVVAIDSDPDILQRARANTPAAVRCELGSLDDGAAELGAVIGAPVDLVWSAHAVHHAADQQACVKTLAALLAPGGRLALAEGGLPTRHLPWDIGIGQPGLEVRLDAATDLWFARMRAELPGSVRMPYGWTEALRRAGLERITSRTLLTERPTPLSAADRERVVERLGRWVERVRPTGFLSVADLAAWDRVLDPGDQHYLAAREDLTDLSADTIHLGHRPA